MSIWNKILLGCIFVTALLLFGLTARALQAHRIWRESYNKHKEAIAAAEQQAKDLVDGTEGSKGLREVKFELYKLLIGRGRVWDKCQPVNVAKDTDPGTDPPQERVLITVQTAQPDAVEAKSVLYAFEDKPASEGGKYLGQFTVTQVGGDQIILRPSVRLSDAEYARVEASRQAATPWRLYELMPTDDHEVLAALTDDQKTTMFPAQSAPDGRKYNDYLYDGQIMLKSEAETLNLNGQVVMVDEAGNPIRNNQGMYTEVEDGKGKFIRTLRDYEVRFDEEHRLRSVTIDRIAVADRDLKFLQDCQAIARRQQQAGNTEIDNLKREKAIVTREANAVTGHEAALDRAIASMKQAIDSLIARNEAAIAQVGQIQTEAARILNARTAGVVQNSSRQPVQP